MNKPKLKLVEIDSAAENRVILAEIRKTMLQSSSSGWVSQIEGRKDSGSWPRSTVLPSVSVISHGKWHFEHVGHHACLKKYLGTWLVLTDCGKIHDFAQTVVHPFPPFTAVCSASFPFFCRGIRTGSCGRYEEFECRLLHFHNSMTYSEVFTNPFTV